MPHSHQQPSFHHEQFARFKGTSTYFVMLNKGMADKWKKDKTIPLTDVVQSFIVYKGEGPAKYEPMHPSKGEMGSDFGTMNDMEIISKILTEGEICGSE
jgi:ribosome maturation protein Sdo1